MDVVNIALHIVSCLLALLAAALLFWVNQERKHSNRILAFLLILFALQGLISMLLFSRLILHVPWLLRIFAPTTFLIGPLAYIYIRSVLKDEIKFRKSDWLLFIPALLTFINFIPFYALSAQEKIDYLNNNFYNRVQNNDSGQGFLPGPVYYLIRIFWSVLFLVGGFRQINHFKKIKTSALVHRNRELLSWLFTFNALLTVVLLIIIFKVIIPSLENIPLIIADIFLGVTILFIGLQLFFRPRILYGVFQPISDLSREKENFRSPGGSAASDDKSITANDSFTMATAGEEISALNIGPDEQLKIKRVIEEHFLEKKPFLQTEYSLEQLVADTRIPRYILSAFINREYGMGFREFINRYRIDFFKKNLGDPAWQNLTLEAIAEECGFNSRSSFISNFKKISGQTPSEYLKTQSERLPDLQAG